MPFDYRNISGPCDAFVSVGMLEHVGLEHYRDIGRVMTAACRRMSLSSNSAAGSLSGFRRGSTDIPTSCTARRGGRCSVMLHF